MTPSNANDGERFITSSRIAGVRVGENVVALTHILGRRRLLCCNFVAEILLRDFQQPATIEQVARQRNSSVDLIRDTVGILRAALLVREADVDEPAAIRHGLDVRFAEPDGAVPANDGSEYPKRLFPSVLQVSGDVASGRESDPFDEGPIVELDTPLQLSPATVAMHFGTDSGGVITHLLEGPLLLEQNLWNLAMTFKERRTLREAMASADLRDADAERMILGCEFLVSRRILCSSADQDLESIRARVASQIELVNERFDTRKDLTPVGFQDPHFAWYQPYGYHDLDTVEPIRARGRVAILGHCQSHFIAGALEHLAARQGWHLETHGWFDAPDELETRDWSVVVLSSVVDAAAFYEAFAVGDIAACQRLAPEIVARINRSVCLIRARTGAPILVLSVGEPTLHGHGPASKTRHALHKIVARLNHELLESAASFERVDLLDETAVLSEYRGVITLDDAFNAMPHHSGFDLWSWRDHPFQETTGTLPAKSEEQIHPALPLARACLEHLRHLYLIPRVKLIVFEPNGLLWPDDVAGQASSTKRINAYTGLDTFIYAGIHESLCTMRARGLRLACLSSSDSERVLSRLQTDSHARNLVRDDDLECVLGGKDKNTLIGRILELTGVSEDEILWIDASHKPEDSFNGRFYNGELWQLRRYLLTEPALNPVAATPVAKSLPRAAEPKPGPAPDRHAVGRLLDRVLCRRLTCPASALGQTDDLSLLGLDSFGCLALLHELENELDFELPDHDYVGSVMFSRQGLLGAITRALDARSTGQAMKSPGTGDWFAGFTREQWCEQDVGSIVSQHFANPRVGWIFKFIRSGASFDYQYVTWNDLRGTALGYTHRFRQAGLKPGDTITILLPQGRPLVAAVVGAILGGMLPSVSAFPSEKLASNTFLQWFGEVVQRSETRCVVCTNELKSLVTRELGEDPTGMPIVTETPEATFDERVHEASPDDPVLLQHSSGTTGIKKGVRLSHRMLLAEIWDLSRRLQCNDGDVIVSWLPYYHDMGLVACLVLPLLRSIPTVVMSPFDWVRQPHMLLRQISEEKATLCWMPNFAFLHSANRVQADELAGVELGSMRALINCSEPITHEAMTAFYERFSRSGLRFSALSSSYAMAETTFAVTQTRPGRPAKTVTRSSDRGNTTTFVASGTVLPGARIRIVDQATVLGEGEIGEIQVQGDYTFAGYHNDEESSREAFDDSWYRTGDLGFVLGDELFVTGRSRDLIIIAGHNVYPHDIENEVGALAGIKPGRVVAFGDYDAGEGTEKLVVLAELDRQSETTPDEAALKATVRERILARFFVNASDVRLFAPGTLRKSTSGKLARTANREIYSAGSERPDRY